MAVDPETIAIAVGVTGIVLIIIALIVLLVLWRKGKKLKKELRLAGTPKPVPQQQIMSITGPPRQQYVPPTFGPYAQYSGYRSWPVTYGRPSPWPQSTMHYRPALGAAPSADDQPTVFIEPLAGYETTTNSGVKEFFEKLPKVEKVNTDDFILPEPEPFILPVSTSDIEPPKKTFDKFILPTDAPAVTEESNEFILPKLEFGEPSQEQNSLYPPEDQNGQTLHQRSDYDPYAPVVQYDTGPVVQPQTQAQQLIVQEVQSPQTPIQQLIVQEVQSPQTPIQQLVVQEVQGPQTPVQPVVVQEVQRPQEIYYYMTHPDDQPLPAEPAEPAEPTEPAEEAESTEQANQEQLSVYTILSPTGASLASTNLPALPPSGFTQGDASRPTGGGASYAGFAVSRQTVCLLKSPKELTCASRKTVYQIKSSPNNNKPKKPATQVWMAVPVKPNEPAQPVQAAQPLQQAQPSLVIHMQK